MLAIVMWAKVGFSRRTEVNLDRLQPTKMSQAEAVEAEAEKEKAEAEAAAEAKAEAKWFGRKMISKMFNKDKGEEEQDESEETNYLKQLGESCEWNNGTEKGKAREEIIEGQDASCEEDLACAQKDVDGRDFGECSHSEGALKSVLHHKLCCSVPTCRYYKEEKSRTCPSGFTSKPNSDSYPVFYPKFKSDMKMTDLEFERACCMKDGIEHDVMYVPNNMAGQKRSKEKTMEDCAKRCSDVKGCAHFSYWEDNGGCHLQASDATSKVAINVTAGKPKWENGSWSAARVAWGLPVFLLFFQINTSMQ
jgi:hypothetical protein